MRIWEGLVTGEAFAIGPLCRAIVASWQRSLALGVDATSRAAPLAARGDNVEELRQRHDDLRVAAQGIFAEATELLAGSRSIVLLTNPEGVVLDAVGDMRTLDEGQGINLMPGGNWNEGVIGTNGIGTALATSRPAQVHAAEHFCDGIKRWTCAAAPVREPLTNAIIGLVDISGPPETYQRNNLTLAIAIARQIETVLGQASLKERMHLLELCLQRLSRSDVAGLVAIDRGGRLVHAAGKFVATAGARIGERVPGFSADLGIDAWATLLPPDWRPEWLTPVRDAGRTIGAMLVIPSRPRSAAGRLAAQSSDADPSRAGFDRIISQSAPMTVVITQAKQLAGRHVPVLIEGESGTGKELLARALHGAPDPSRPFIAFSCGAVSRELVAGELFGHVAGAFTGAVAGGRAGRFELAHKGTLCLDEIGEMPLDLQPVLLRVLEEGIVYRLGDAQPRQVDVRLIAVTNRNLRDEVAAGRFRRDLFFRICVTRIVVPPLRARHGDVPLLIEFLMHRLAQRHGVPLRHIHPEAMELLERYSWPGNVRELRNVVETLLLTGTGAEATCEDILPLILPEDDAMEGEPHARDDQAPSRLDEAEREVIRRAIRRANGNLTESARQLGISRSTLYRKLKHYTSAI
jgi:transcriptional regulator of acetoin/glycerol metabolism